MRKNTGRRMNPVSWYIGSGNRTSSFTVRPKTAFRKVKQIYGDELQRFEVTKSDSEIERKYLSEEDRKKIKYNVKRQIKREQIKNIAIGFFVTLFIILTLVTLNFYYTKLF